MKKIVIGLVVLAILVGGVIAGYVLFQRQQDVRSDAAPATTLAMSASPSQLDIDDPTVVTITIDTGENVVDGADMYITFDPTILQADGNMIAGSFLPGAITVNGEPNNTAGTISYTIYMPPGTPGVQGTGTLATINFTAIGSGTSSVAFGPSTTVGAFDEGQPGQNVLVQTTPASITVSESQAESHLACQNLSCVVVAGPGVDECTVATQAEDCAAPASPSPSPSASPSPGTSPSPSPSASPLASPGTGGGGTGSGSGSGSGSTATPTPTPANNLPVSGVTGPTMIVASFGALFILLGLAALAL